MLSTLNNLVVLELGYVEWPHRRVPHNEERLPDKDYRTRHFLLGALDLGPVISACAGTLEVLVVDYCKIRSLAPVARCKALRCLSLNDSVIVEGEEGCLTALSDLPQLLNCNRTGVSDISPLASISTLRSLEAKDCDKIRTMLPLVLLTGLTRLSLCQLHLPDWRDERDMVLDALPLTFIP
jgi:hypothetical protein